MGKVKNYGVWAATPISYTAQTDAEDSRSPHITLSFKDDDNRTKTAAINVKSISQDARLVYWFDKDFSHPITQSLRELDPGFHFVPDRDQSNAHLKLDFIRQNPPLLQLTDGLLLPHDIPGPDNDVLDKMKPILDAAIDDPANKVYIFGSSFNTGIHDVHMNQGSDPKFANGVGQDGALIVYFAHDDRFEAVFLAFASQRVPTDDRGLATDDSQALSELATRTETLFGM